MKHITDEDKVYLRLKYDVREFHEDNAVRLTHNIPDGFFDLHHHEYGLGYYCKYVPESIEPFYSKLLEYDIEFVQEKGV